MTFSIFPTLKNFFSNLKEIWNVRLLYHAVDGITIGYLAALILGFTTQNFPLDLKHWNNYLCGFIAFLPAALVCFLWDKWQYKSWGAKPSNLKMVLTGLAGIIGGYLEIIYPNWIVAIILTGISVTLVFKHYKN